MYEILDDFRTPIDSRIAQPILDTVQIKPDKVPFLDNTYNDDDSIGQEERWPEKAIPFHIWACSSLLAFHCSWMLSQESVLRYATAYWCKLRCLPALGHLHFVYNNPFGVLPKGHTTAPWIHFTPQTTDSFTSMISDEAHEVFAPAALCVCDCAFMTMTEAELPKTNGCVDLLRQMLVVTICALPWPTDIDKPPFPMDNPFIFRSDFSLLLLLLLLHSTIAKQRDDGTFGKSMCAHGPANPCTNCSSLCGNHWIRNGFRRFWNSMVFVEIFHLNRLSGISFNRSI